MDTNNNNSTCLGTALKESNNMNTTTNSSRFIYMNDGTTKFLVMLEQVIDTTVEMAQATNRDGVPITKIGVSYRINAAGARIKVIDKNVPVMKAVSRTMTMKYHVKDVQIVNDILAAAQLAYAESKSAVIEGYSTRAWEASFIGKGKLVWTHQTVNAAGEIVEKTVSKVVSKTTITQNPASRAAIKEAVRIARNLNAQMIPKEAVAAVETAMETSVETPATPRRTRRSRKATV